MPASCLICAAEPRAPDGGIDGADALGERAALDAHVLAHAHAALRLQLHAAALVGAVHLVYVGEEHAFARRTDALARHVVQAEHHVL